MFSVDGKNSYRVTKYFWREVFPFFLLFFTLRPDGIERRSTQGDWASKEIFFYSSL